MEAFIECPKCQKESFHTNNNCDFCGASLEGIKKANEQKATEELDKKVAAAKNTGDYSTLLLDEIDNLSKDIILTTETFMPDREIAERIDVVSSECVFGMNIFRDFFASVTDFFGGRSVASQKVLRDARRACLTELRREALMVEANAIIGTTLNYSEISGKGKSMLLLVATGTAVRLK